MRILHASLVLAFVLAGAAPAAARGIPLAGPGLDPGATLRAENSLVGADAARARAGAPAVRWHGVEWRSRLHFLAASGADFGAADRVSLWIHAGTLQGESLSLVACPDEEEAASSFHFVIQLTWSGWYRMEVPLLRFGRDGPIRWPQVKRFFLAYDGRKQDGEILLDEVLLLSTGEIAEKPAAGAGPDAGDEEILEDFEKKAASLVRWDARDSRVELSVDTVKKGQWAARWLRVGPGSSLEYVGAPFPVRGYDRFAAWIFATAELEGGLVVAYGNGPSRMAWCSTGTLAPGWNRVVLPLRSFRRKGEISVDAVEHLVFLYEGREEQVFVLDEIGFIGPVAPEPGTTPDPAHAAPSPGTVLHDDEGNALIAGEEVTARPEALASSATRTSEPWYLRQGRRTLKWFALTAGAELVFSHVPPDPTEYGRVEAWIYSDCPAGTLEVVFVGEKGEARTDVDVDWIGWKRVEIALRAFRGLGTSGPLKSLAFRFASPGEGLREFYFDEVRILRG